MRASTTPTTWMEETEAKSSCTGCLRDRGGGGIRKGFGGHEPFWCSFLMGQSPQRGDSPAEAGWWDGRWTFFPVLEALVWCWRPMVLEVICVTSAPGLSLFLCYVAEWLSGHMLGKGTCH